MLSDLDILLKCPLGLDYFLDPVQTSDGNTYERHNIQRWSGKEPENATWRSPLTNEELTDDVSRLPRNFAVASLVETHLKMYAETDTYKEWLQRKDDHGLKLTSMTSICKLLRERASPCIKRQIYTHLCGSTMEEVLQYEIKLKVYCTRRLMKRKRDE